MVAFLPSKRAAKANAETAKERKKRRDRERWHDRKKATQTQERFATMWAEREGKALQVVHKLKTNVHINDIAKALEVQQAVAGDVMRRLVGKGFVIATGGVGRYRRYSIPE
jgi:ribosomal protein S25